MFGPDRNDLFAAMFQEADRLKQFRNDEALAVCRHLQAGDEECARWVMTTFLSPRKLSTRHWWPGKRSWRNRG